MLITGTLPGWCHAQGMASYLLGRGIRLFDYPEAMKPLAKESDAAIAREAAAAGLTIEWVARPNRFRKEEAIQQILAQRGDAPGLVHSFKVMEACTRFVPWRNKDTGETGLRAASGKCAHYYVYFIDPDYGLCFLRVPTWAPFRLEFYCNGHSWLARQLAKAGIAYTPLDNTFLQIADWHRAQELADSFSVEALHHLLDSLAQRFCPVIRHVPDGYHWSLLQIEYATDLVFRRAEDLPPLYQALVQAAVHTVTPDQVAQFFGHPLDPRSQAALETDYRVNRRLNCTRLKHTLGWASVKLYDKGQRVLRIETTVNKVSEFKHYRTVEHRDGTSEMKLAPMRQTIYSLPPLRDLLRAVTRRYLDWLSALDDPTEGSRHLTTLGTSRRQDDRPYRGFNLFQTADLDAVRARLQGTGAVAGITNRALRALLPGRTSAPISYFLKRCRVFKLLRRCQHRYRYHLTQLGRRLALAALRVRELVIVPTLAGRACV
jgi:hypothetical protein